jgi:uncharacterized protein (TIGR00255 family)
MRSMTGFGRAEFEQGGVSATVEVKSLNQRFLEVKLALPRSWSALEGEMRREIQKSVARGRVEVVVRTAGRGKRPSPLVVDEELARSYVDELRGLRERLGLAGEIGVDLLLHRPEILRFTEENEVNHNAAVEVAFSALRRALKALESERSREGRGLKRDLAARLSQISRALPVIARTGEKWRRTTMAKFRAKVRGLMGTLPVDERELLQEAAELAQKADISEEVTRLKSHTDGLRALFNRDGSVGKSIEFLLQEVGRELNTIGAKAQDAALSRLVVELKGQLEKMREQVQNVE